MEKREGEYGVVVVVRQYIKSGLTINESSDVSYKLISDVFVFSIHGKCLVLHFMSLSL